MNNGIAILNVVSGHNTGVKVNGVFVFGYSVSLFMFRNPCAGFIVLPKGGAKGVFKGSSAHLSRAFS